MVIVKLSGGIGNQMYQYAVSRSIAHRLNTELKFDLSDASFRKRNHGHYRLCNFNIQENFATPEEIEHVKKNGIIIPPLPNLENCQRDIFIQGHWMHSEEFFIEIADIIRSEFTLRNPLHENSAAWERKILAAENSISLHIRHGDYVKGGHIHIIGAVPLAYYKTCVETLQKTFPNLTAFVFSDDLPWVQENLKLDVPTEFVSDCETDDEEFYLMSICKHNAIANSTFSWWAAWLNPNPDKKVFVPEPWARSRLWNNGIPASWIKVRVNYEDTPIDFPPLLSIIVHAKDNVATLGTLLSSIFNQTFKDYELILIDDASTDGSENIYRQVVTNKKVTLLRTAREIGKAAAWNRGLDCARGEYVLFLTGDDLILPNAVHSLCRTYSTKAVNLICHVHYLEEDPVAGNLAVVGIGNKRFSQRVDKGFKSLSIPLPFDNKNLNQKLLMLGDNVFNSLIGTKFFRRDFLIKNSLRFNENTKTDVEFPFVVNAVMLNETIMFVPQSVYAMLKTNTLRGGVNVMYFAACNFNRAA